MLLIIAVGRQHCVWVELPSPHEAPSVGTVVACPLWCGGGWLEGVSNLGVGTSAC